jgi:hypothetical protein
MVSSTFYDLRQIRADLTGFIVDGLSYTPLLSELHSFPIDPDADTTENCRQRVEKDADILILVIGGRYGYIDSKTSKSITNLEYLAARSKGIPVFIFVEKNVLALINVWKGNPSADFSSVVDDTRVLAFIDQVRSIDKVWTFEFETAQDIVNTLRIQFGYLMQEGLQWRFKLRTTDDFPIHYLTGESLRQALEKPPYWEYRLFTSSLADQIAACKDIRREYNLELVFGVSENVSADQLLEWFLPRIHELEGIITALTKLVNETAREAFGPDGKPGDAELIAFATRKIGQAYREAIEWALRVRRATVDEALLDVKQELSQFSADVIHKIEKLGPEITTKLDDALASLKPGDHPVVQIKFEITLPNADQFSQALKKAQSVIARRRSSN